MSGDARQFALEIDREWAEQWESLHDAVSYVGLAGIKGVVEKSPVDSGRFKGNWSMTIGEPDPNEEAGGVGYNSVLAEYSQLEAFPALYIQNNLPYAQPLEDGSSDQAPAGMVALTLAELAALWEGMSL